MGGSIKTDNKAKFIAQMADEFRAAQIQTFIVYYDESETGLKDTKNQLHHLTIKPNDNLISKKDDSAFRKGAKTNTLLKEHGITHLLVSGFNAHACIKQTVMDAITSSYFNYQVGLIKDMIGDTDLGDEAIMRQLKEMERHGAVITSSQQALSHLKAC